MFIESVEVSGGVHDGLTLNFCERTNALIGPPNAGKSLIVDCLKFVFNVQSSIQEVEKVTTARMSKCLPAGSTVTVRYRHDGKSHEISRTVEPRLFQTPHFDRSSSARRN